jgi:S-(hydroxymethyl)glutathione dehydrogenase/alcohol dehydrogenase
LLTIEQALTALILWNTRYLAQTATGIVHFFGQTVGDGHASPRHSVDGRYRADTLPCAQPGDEDAAMKAAILHAPQPPLTIEEVDIANPGPQEVLVRTAVTGLCHSDLHFIDGAFPHPLPLVLGHEASGVVEAVDTAVTHVKPGDPVVLCLSVFCGQCPHCLTGHPALCDTPEVNLPPGVSRRLSWQGAPLHQFYNTSTFAEQVLVHEQALVKIRDDMPLDRAALLGCAVLTGTGAVFDFRA